MFNVGGPEVLVILLVALIALGPSQLPEAARKVGQVMSEIRKVSSSFQRELTSAFEMEEQQKAKEQPKEKPKSAGGPTDVTVAADEEPSVEPAGETSDDPA
jgi:sec-independent protein translocase protein TatB